MHVCNVLPYTTSLSFPNLLGSPNLSPSNLCTLCLKVTEPIITAHMCLSLAMPWGMYNFPLSRNGLKER